MSDGEFPGLAPDRTRTSIPAYWWPLWIGLLAICIVVFYGVFTPVWIGIRLAAWLSERAPRRRGAPASAGAAPERR